MRNEFELIRLGQEYPTLSADDYKVLLRLRRLTKKLHRYCEDYCNLADFDYKLIEKTDKKIKYQIKELSSGLMIDLEEIQHDPRGWEVKTNSYFINLFLNWRG